MNRNNDVIKRYSDRFFAGVVIANLDLSLHPILFYKNNTVAGDEDISPTIYRIFFNEKI